MAARARPVGAGSGRNPARQGRPPPARTCFKHSRLCHWPEDHGAGPARSARCDWSARMRIRIGAVGGSNLWRSGACAGGSAPPAGRGGRVKWRAVLSLTVCQPCARGLVTRDRRCVWGTATASGPPGSRTPFSSLGRSQEQPSLPMLYRFSHLCSTKAAWPRVLFRGAVEAYCCLIIYTLNIQRLRVSMLKLKHQGGYCMSQARLGVTCRTKALQRRLWGSQLSLTSPCLGAKVEDSRVGRALPAGQEGDAAHLFSPGQAHLKFCVQFWAPQDRRNMKLLEWV